jgi:hypothetical protein
MVEEERQIAPRKNKTAFESCFISAEAQASAEVLHEHVTLSASASDDV